VWPAFGDAHLENFGFNIFQNEEVRFVYNDFDDSGYAPVGIDAVRYFIVLQLLKVDGNTIKDLIKYYSKLVVGENAVDLDELSKNWKVDGKHIYKYWKPEKRLSKAQDEFNQLSAFSDPVVDEIKKIFGEKKKLKQFNVVDVRKYDEHQTGGSGGLSRFWVSVTINGDIIDIIEFKQLTKYPGTGFLWKNEPSMETHIKWCANAFWPKSPKRYLDLEVKFSDERYFQVRSRVKQTLKAKEDSEKMDLWKIQLDIMAAHHFGGWKTSGISSKELEKWLLENSLFIAQRYTTIFENNQKTFKSNL